MLSTAKNTPIALAFATLLFSGSWNLYPIAATANSLPIRVSGEATSQTL